MLIVWVCGATWMPSRQDRRANAESLRSNSRADRAAGRAGRLRRPCDCKRPTAALHPWTNNHLNWSACRAVSAWIGDLGVI